MKILAYLILAAVILGGIGYSYRATWSAGHDDGYNKRVSEDAGAFAAAEDKGRKAQTDADQQTIGQLRQALADSQDADAKHQRQLADMKAGKADLQRRFDDVAKQPDAQAWFAGRIPDDVLCSLQQPPAGSGAPPGCPGH